MCCNTLGIYLRLCDRANESRTHRGYYIIINYITRINFSQVKRDVCFIWERMLNYEKILSGILAILMLASSLCFLQARKD